MLVRDWKDPGTGEAGNTLHLHPLVPQYVEGLEKQSLGRLTPVDTSDLPCPLNGNQALQGRALGSAQLPFYSAGDLDPDADSVYSQKSKSLRMKTFLSHLDTQWLPVGSGDPHSRQGWARV